MLLLQAAVPAPTAPATIRAPFTFGSLGQPSPFTFGSLGQPSPFTFGPQPAAAAVPSTSTFGFGGVGGAPGASPAAKPPLFSFGARVCLTFFCVCMS